MRERKLQDYLLILEEYKLVESMNLKEDSLNLDVAYV